MVVRLIGRLELIGRLDVRLIGRLEVKLIGRLEVMGRLHG